MNAPRTSGRALAALSALAACFAPAPTAAPDTAAQPAPQPPKRPSAALLMALRFDPKRRPRIHGAALVDRRYPLATGVHGPIPEKPSRQVRRAEDRRAVWSQVLALKGSGDYPRMGRDGWRNVWRAELSQ